MLSKSSMPNAVPALVALAAAAVLAAAFGFEYLGGYAPCELCLYQRWPYVIAIAFGPAAWGLARTGRAGAGRVLILACAAVFVLGGVLAGYHVGVEEGWWQGPTTCSGPGGGAAGVEALLARIEAAPIVRCDEVQWRLLGLSMAGYNVLLSLGLAAFCLWPRLWALIPGRGLWALIPGRRR